MDIANLDGWVGRTQTATAPLMPERVDELRATLSSETQDASEPGTAAPLLAHWTVFPPRVGMDALGSDGHPKLGDFLPPLDLPRRMWAGGEVRFHAPVHVGETLTKTSTLSAITRKEGRTSDMVFVTVDHELRGDAGAHVTERQDIVYLPMPEVYQPPKPVPAIEGPDVEEAFAITQTRLFRYSAVTFNAHRIHYDLPYAQGVEKLPGLVVHGPLQATALVQLAERAKGTAPARLKYRSIHPMFHDDDLRLLGKWETPNEMKLCTAAATGGHTGMQATAFWEDTP